MGEDLDVVFVSNRGPLSFIDTGSGFEKKRGAGGLAGALDPVARRLGGRAVWIAAATSEDDRAAIRTGAADDLAELLGYRAHLLDVEPETYSRYYNVVSNRMLWFANHCLWDELDIHGFGEDEIAAWHQAYEPVNKMFADAVHEAADPRSLVLFQDYHLSTAPGHLRNKRPQQSIFHFTHSSFCGVDGLNALPRPIPRLVIQGMLGADLLGFHVAPWVHGFMSCAERLGASVDPIEGSVEYRGRKTWVRAYPITVDSRDLLTRAASRAAREWTRRFQRRAADGPLVVRVDRTEPSKNIIRGFDAFSLLLDDRPELSGRAHFIACIYPSRQEMKEYRSYTDQIRKTVDEINERHPDSIDLYLEDDFDRALGAYCVYDALLVNPLMDGMNLVSKEGPIVNERDGVLVLSTSAGSFEEMGDHAVPILDPLDVTGTAAALGDALDMPAIERSRLARRARDAATRTTPEHWIESQLEDLVAIRDTGRPVSPAV